jgi:kynureninase
VTSPRRIYLDGNSLGPPAPGTAGVLGDLVEDWGRELIGGWNAGWWELPMTVGETWRLWLDTPHPTVI